MLENNAGWLTFVLIGGILYSLFVFLKARQQGDTANVFLYGGAIAVQLLFVVIINIALIVFVALGVGLFVLGIKWLDDYLKKEKSRKEFLLQQEKEIEVLKTTQENLEREYTYLFAFNDELQEKNAKLTDELQYLEGAVSRLNIFDADFLEKYPQLLSYMEAQKQQYKA